MSVFGALTLLVASAAATAGRAEDTAGACAPESGLALDLDAWRRDVLAAANDRDALSRELERAGFQLDFFTCLREGRPVAVDVFPAALAGPEKTDRVVQVRMRGCLFDRDSAVFVRMGRDRWCRLRGELDKGVSGTCEIPPPVLRLVHLTDPKRQTLRIDAWHGDVATGEGDEKVCAKSGVVQFWDVRDGRLVYRLEVRAGPITLSGGFPKRVRAKDELGETRTFRLSGDNYVPEAGERGAHAR